MSVPWIDLVKEATARWSTPFYLAAWAPVRTALDELAPLADIGLPIRHWLSLKTQLVKPLLFAARDAGLGAEAISHYELLAAEEAGFPADRILLNGVAKHLWLPRESAGLGVHFDSLTEVESIPADRLRSCRLGVRCQIETGHEPGDPTIGGQFGMTANEMAAAADRLGRSGLEIEGLHFHLRSNIRDAATYVAAAGQALAMANQAGITPRYIDFGGGFPVPGEGTWMASGQLERGALPLDDLVVQLKPLLAGQTSVAELWFENGRFLTARSAVLVMTVTDIKDRPGCRYILCDGGRTNHALPSDWEEHPFATIPPRTGQEVFSVVCGPTCTAYDRLIRRPLPGDIRIGDRLVWFDAGAYHLSWETRFSHGLAKVIWCDEEMRLTLAREEPFGRWWGIWT